MGKPKSIVVGDRYNGVSVGYAKSRKALYISGWWQGLVGLTGTEERAIPLAKFLRDLDISLRDCEKALGE